MREAGREHPGEEERVGRRGERGEGQMSRPEVWSWVEESEGGEEE